MIKKIVVLGPESTGKSSLCAQLAAYYKTNWVKEYAREYLLAHGTAYTFDELLTIAQGQLLLEENGITELKEKQEKEKSNSPLLFIDTNMYVMKVWCEFVFGQCHHWILNQVVERKYDLYLLCNIDVPWVRDELREYPDLQTREKLYHHYKDIMVNQEVTWVDVRGNYEERFQLAVTAIDRLH